MHFVLADDQTSHLDVLAGRLKEVCASLGIPAVIGLSAGSVQEVLDYAKTAPEETVWLLDIEMNDPINGIELCRRIREANRNAYIIYVSAYQRYALECCQSHAFDFLLKPWTDEQLAESLKALQRDMMQRKKGTELLIQLGTRTIRLIQEEICYFSKDRMSVTAHCADGQTYTWRESLDSLAARLSDRLFFSCHRSYLVNLQAIREIRLGENLIVLKNEQTVPVSRRKEAELKKHMRDADK